MTDSVILRQAHAVEGSIELLVEGETAALHCRWPFDLTTDDFIEISNTFATEAVTQMIADLRESGKGQAEAVNVGFVRIERAGRELIFEASNSGKGELSRSLLVRMPETALVDNFHN
jgi:hypothetical protein